MYTQQHLKLQQENIEDYFSELSKDMKDVLEDRLQEDENTYLSAKESIDQLRRAYNIF